MRWCASIGAVLVAGAVAGGDVAGRAAPGPGTRAAAAEEKPSVDVELILAVDVSYSMDLDELASSARVTRRPSTRRNSCRR